jgi:hypothetical protein
MPVALALVMPMRGERPGESPDPAQAWAVCVRPDSGRSKPWVKSNDQAADDEFLA